MSGFAGILARTSGAIESRCEAFTGKIQKVVVEVGPVKLAAAEADGLRKAEVARRAAESIRSQTRVNKRT